MSTGIIRRIDDLGRVVIPKEVRRVLRVREGDPLEISADENCITLTPYRVKDIREVSITLLNTYYKQFRLPVAICDRHEIIASHGFSINPHAKISDTLEFHIHEGTEYLSGNEQGFDVLDNSDRLKAAAIFPINADNDKVGGIVLFGNDAAGFTDAQITCARFMAESISDQLSLGGA